MRDVEPDMLRGQRAPPVTVAAPMAIDQPPDLTPSKPKDWTGFSKPPWLPRKKPGADAGSPPGLTAPGWPSR